MIRPAADCISEEKDFILYVTKTSDPQTNILEQIEEV